MKLTDIAWLAGLLEGEGCFYLGKDRAKKEIYPCIKLQMTDEDIVVRAAALMKSKVEHYGNTWVTRVYGAHTIAWMMTLYPYLGERRREKVAKVIQVWKEHVYVQAPNGVRLMATCHSDRLAYGSDQLCKACHISRYNARRYRKKGLPKRVRAMAKCHPDRVMAAFGMCKICYDRSYRKKQLLKLTG